MAFFFDRAVGVFGVHLENELSKAENRKGKRSEAQKAMAKKMVLQRYLRTAEGLD